MEQQHTKKEENVDRLYYIIGLVFGLITGGVIEKGFVWIPAGGVVGLLFAALFVNVLVKGREHS